jgi:iron(III) transport system substrate-binding protein
VVSTAVVKNSALDALGKFKMENVPVAAMGKNQAAAQKILDRAGYK